MNPVESRPLTLTEQRALRRIAQRNAFVVHAWWSGMVFAFVSINGALCIRCVAGPPGNVQKVVLASIGGALALALLWALERSGRPARAALAADLAGGRATIETFDAIDAIEIEVEDYVGASYYLALSDGRVLFLPRRDLHGHEQDFPSTRFAIARAPRSRRLLGMECLGEKLDPSSKLALTLEENEANPDEGEILQVDFESLRRG